MAYTYLSSYLCVLCVLIPLVSGGVRFSISKAEHESIEQLEVRPQLDAHVTYADVC